MKVFVEVMVKQKRRTFSTGVEVESKCFNGCAMDAIQHFKNKGAEDVRITRINVKKQNIAE